MFKFLKKFFQDDEPAQEINLAELDSWFQEQIKNLPLKQSLSNYFDKIEELKRQLIEKTGLLKIQQVSDKDKNVEQRVQNIVIGHKDNYARAVERFTLDLSLPDRSLTTIDNFQKTLVFNEELRKKLDLLAKQTAKSYQASQHLFFEPVEAIFKLLGELNILVKNFDAKRIKALERMNDSIVLLQDEIQKEGNYNRWITEKEEVLEQTKKDAEKETETLKKLQEGEEFKGYQLLKEKEKQIEHKYKLVEDEIFSLFSRLQKPLKKYERIALDNKPILPYLDDGLKAFWKDTDYKIVPALTGLKKSLQGRHLEFSDKQKDNFVALIERCEQGYLSELRDRCTKIREELAEVRAQISTKSIKEEISKNEESIASLERKRTDTEKEIADLKNKLARTGIEEAKEGLPLLAKDAFGKEVKIL